MRTNIKAQEEKNVELRNVGTKEILDDSREKQYPKTVIYDRTDYWRKSIKRDD